MCTAIEFTANAPSWPVEMVNQTSAAQKEELNIPHWWRSRLRLSSLGDNVPRGGGGETGKFVQQRDSTSTTTAVKIKLIGCRN